MKKLLKRKQIYYNKLIALLVFVFIVLEACPAFSQNKELIIYNLRNLKKGVYKNFDEFKYNRPSQQIPLQVEQKEKDDSRYETLTSYYVRYDKDSFKLQHGEFWGFCDGRNIYINRKLENKPKGKVWCERLYKIDRYCNFKIITYINRGTYGGGSSSYVQIRILSLQSGEISDLTKSTLRELLEVKDPELFKSYKEEKQKKEVLNEYLEKFCDRHRNEL